jgi:SAM-dependent methyltransferase
VTLMNKHTSSCCRSCGGSALTTILDLGLQPIANALVEPEKLCEAEDRFPLRIVFCHGCSLVQIAETIPPTVLFGSDYPYFSSFSPALLAHSRAHAVALIQERRLGPDSLVIEVGSNDGYLLKTFVEAGIPVLGIDPASGPAAEAEQAGIRTRVAFFDTSVARDLVREGYSADVIIANNVLAHVEGINSFLHGIAMLLAEDGVARFEVPYLRDLIDACEFDTIYHEHVFYFSLGALEPLFARHRLHLTDVERLDIHGGSLRLTASKAPGASDRLKSLRAEEAELGMSSLTYYASFGQRVAALRDELRSLILELTVRGASVAAYGAAAKGVTLLNYMGIGGETLPYVVDRNVHKVGKLMPGLKLPIQPVDTLVHNRPDYLLLLAWNFADEIMEQQRAYAELGGRFIIPIPSPLVVELESASASSTDRRKYVPMHRSQGVR